MFKHDISVILIVEPNVPPFLPLHQGKLEARPDTPNNSGSRPPASDVFAGDDLALKVTPIHLNLRIAVIERKGHSINGVSTRYPARVPFAFE